jgi:uncharacterized protein involved in cysteine biosynthesis
MVKNQNIKRRKSKSQTALFGLVTMRDVMVPSLSLFLTTIIIIYMKKAHVYSSHTANYQLLQKIGFAEF